MKRYGVLVAPNKECVYSQFLPSNILVSSRRPVHLIIDEVPDCMAFSYPLDELQAATHQVYPKGDTHWNMRGALIGLQSIASKLSFAVLQEEEIEFYMDTRGDLSGKVGETTEYERGKVRRPRAKLVYNNDVPNTGHKIVYENPDSTLPSCVLFRDSFATILLPIMAESFSRFVAVWQANIDYTLLDRETPDFVLSEMAERFLIQIPDDESGKTNEEYVAEKQRPV